MPSVHFKHLETRCNLLIKRFLDPLIAAEEAAVVAGQPVPDPNFDDFAAFRLLTHAELEGYFESKAHDALKTLEEAFNKGQVQTSSFVTLIYLHFWKSRQQLVWPNNSEDDATHMKQLAQNALCFGRQFVLNNNGIKEASIQVLSALMGIFPEELDSVLVNELNQYGKKRGDVAHSSWHFNTRTFESADIEKSRLTTILALTKAFYEK